MWSYGTFQPGLYLRIVLSSEQRVAMAVRRSTIVTMYVRNRDPCSGRAAGEMYKQSEQSVSRNRKTSTLLDSSSWLEVIGVVQPTPVSQMERLRLSRGALVNGTVNPSAKSSPMPVSISSSARGLVRTYPVEAASAAGASGTLQNKWSIHSSNCGISPCFS